MLAVMNKYISHVEPLVAKHMSLNKLLSASSLVGLLCLLCLVCKVPFKDSLGRVVMVQKMKPVNECT